jgi:microcystin-dependent protein
MTGEVFWKYGSGVRAGAVRMNGRTISSTAGSGTERANDDTELLFKHLWAADTSLAVVGGRGASADADWSANKALSLPDGRGRGLFGSDDMGSGVVTSRIGAGALFDFGNETTLGSYGGRGYHILTVGEMPTHSHFATATVGNGGGHTHPGAVATSNGSHQHDYNRDGDVTVQSGTGATIKGSGNNTVSTGTGGSHTHDVTMLTAGDHSHTVTVTNANNGGNTTHNNMPPFVLGTWYMRL